MDEKWYYFIFASMLMLSVGTLVGQSSHPFSPARPSQPKDLLGVLAFQNVVANMTYEGRLNVTNGFSRSATVYVYLDSEPTYLLDYANCSLSLNDGDVLKSKESREVLVLLEVGDIHGLGEFYITFGCVKHES